LVRRPPEGVGESSNRALQRAYRDLQETQAQLVHAEKMSALGQLVAGIAHELNNPINFIYSNMVHLREYLSGIKRVLEAYSQAGSLSDDDRDRIEQIENEVGLDYVLGDLDGLVADCSEGAERARAIVADLRTFSRVDEMELKEADIHQGIETTLNLLAHRYKRGITVHRDYGDIPKITCYPGQLNQVFMNVLANAGQAIEDEGDVWITTRQEDDSVLISIRDNGRGIPKESLSKIFDPFFTTKKVGEGTGLGLSISYGIVKRHKGEIWAESEEGLGATFFIKLPIKQ